MPDLTPQRHGRYCRNGWKGETVQIVFVDGDIVVYDRLGRVAGPAGPELKPEVRLFAGISWFLTNMYPEATLARIPIDTPLPQTEGAWATERAWTPPEETKNALEEES